MSCMKIKYTISVVIFLVISCTRPQQKKTEKSGLSNVIDSVIYDDLKFGITRIELLKQFSISPQQNIMSEPLFDDDVTEVEGSVDIKSHHFVVYHYFDTQDSLYRVKAEFRTADQPEYDNTVWDIAEILYMHYGIPKRWKTIPGSYKFSWDLKNKQIFLEAGCFMQNCLVEVSITELRLFIKNRDKINPGPT